MEKPKEVESQIIQTNKKLEEQQLAHKDSFKTITLPIILTFLGLVLTCLLYCNDQHTKSLDSKFEAQKTVLEMQLKNYEAKANPPLPSPKKP